MAQVALRDELQEEARRFECEHKADLRRENERLHREVERVSLQVEEESREAHLIYGLMGTSTYSREALRSALVEEMESGLEEVLPPTVDLAIIRARVASSQQRKRRIIKEGVQLLEWVYHMTDVVVARENEGLRYRQGMIVRSSLELFLH